MSENKASVNEKQGDARTALRRRRFLQILGASSAAACLSPLPFRARANGPATYEGVHWVQLHAQGAWDPIFLCDPSDNPDFNTLSTSIRSAGNIRYADLPAIAANDPRLGPNDGPALPSHRDFFEKYAPNLLVINGIDTQTTNHKTGVRTTVAGRIQGQHPTFTAMAAADFAPDVPLQFLSASGYEVTGGLVPISRIASLDNVQRVIYPHAINANEAITGAAPVPIYEANVHARIAAAQRARTEALRDASRLPSERASLQRLLDVRAAAPSLQRLRLPMERATIENTRLGQYSNLRARMQFVIAAFKAGLAGSANLSLGGFDTHGNHNENHPLRLAQLLGAIDYLMEEAARAGIGNRLGLLITSDFARTPTYNNNQGKDHWEVTSMMVMGPGITGNRVIGATDEKRKAVPIDPSDPSKTRDDGVVLTPAHIHRALRKHAGLSSAISSQFALPGEDLPLFA